MINRVHVLVSSALALAGLAALPASSARADLEACGGVFLSAQSACEYRPKEECMTQCMTVAVEQACVTQEYNECETSCTQTASTECEAGCTSSCQDQCTTTATTSSAPTCMELCLDDCGGDDNGYCGHSTHQSACGRCAKHNCEKRCEAKCGDATNQPKVTTTTECMPTCSIACSASCTAKVNTQCQVDCQERTYTQCEQKMVEQCQTDCMQTGGAIFCDGQFINASNAQSCADELLGKLKIDIDVKASVQTVGDSASNAVDKAGKKIDKACSVANPGAAGSAPFALIPLGFIFAWRIRRRR